VTDQGDLGPLKLLEYPHAPGSFCLMLAEYDMEPVMDVFEEHGYHGNGYGWLGVAYSAMRTLPADLGERIDFDPEAGTFVALSHDPKR
jgi:Immunity protein 51